jgi:hypothetical protein
MYANAGISTCAKRVVQDFQPVYRCTFSPLHSVTLEAQLHPLQPMLMGMHLYECVACCPLARTEPFLPASFVLDLVGSW